MLGDLLTSWGSLCISDLVVWGWRWDGGNQDQPIGYDGGYSSNISYDVKNSTRYRLLAINGVRL